MNTIITPIIDLFNHKDITESVQTIKEKQDEFIFVCSPLRAYGKYEQKDNIQRAVDYCRQLALQHKNPIAPHLYYPNFLNDNDFYERIIGLKLGLQLLKICTEMHILIFNGWISEGMHKEIKHAEKLGIKIEKIYLGDNS